MLVAPVNHVVPIQTSSMLPTPTWYSARSFKPVTRTLLPLKIRKKTTFGPLLLFLCQENTSYSTNERHSHPSGTLGRPQHSQLLVSPLKNARGSVRQMSDAPRYPEIDIWVSRLASLCHRVRSPDDDCAMSLNQ